MPVTGFTIAHLVLAFICAFLAIAQLLMWWWVRTKRAHLWMAVTFLGYALVTLGVAGSSVAASAALGPTVPWILVGTLSVLPLWVGLLMTAWSVVERELTFVRRALIAVAVVLGLARIVEVALVLGGRAGANPTWELLMNSNLTITVWPAWLMTLECGSVCIWEAVGSWKRRGALAAVLGVMATVAAGVVLREVAMTLGWVEGASLLGLTAFPFLFFASLVVAFEYARVMRGQGEHGLRQYKILKPIAQGGMGELYLATRRGPAGFERFLALKRIRRSGKSRSSEWQERFLSEARLAAHLRHPNIVSVYDLGHAPDGWFIVMEYLTGASLVEILKRARRQGKQMAASFVVDVAEQVCRGLAHAHRSGVIHRDISPHNIMVSFDGHVKIVDFGIAKEHGSAQVRLTAEDWASPSISGSDLTRTGAVVGKRGYLSPERVTGNPALPASDLFSVGVVMYEALGGRRPFKGDTPMALARAILTGEYPRLDGLRPDLPDRLVEVVAQALAVRVQDRFESAQAFGDALREVARELPEPAVGEVVRELFPERWEEEMSITTGRTLRVPSQDLADAGRDEASLSSALDASVSLPAESETVAQDDEAHAATPDDVPTALHRRDTEE